MNNIVIYKYCKRKRGGVFGPKIMRKLELILQHLYYFKKLSNFIQGDSDHHIKSINSWITQGTPQILVNFSHNIFLPNSHNGTSFLLENKQASFHYTNNGFCVPFCFSLPCSSLWLTSTFQIVNWPGLKSFSFASSKLVNHSVARKYAEISADCDHVWTSDEADFFFFLMNWNTFTSPWTTLSVIRNN